MKRPPKMKTPDHTRLNLDQEKYYRPFIEGYIKILESNLKRVKHIGNNYQYTTFTCGEPHDRRNPNWKPFGLLWKYCERTGYDFSVARDILFERIGRKLVCECEMLRDDERRRRIELERMFVAFFGGPGERGLELVEIGVWPALLEWVKVCIAFANIKRNFRFSR